MNTSREPPAQIKALDRSDKLAAKRDEFLLPANTIYLNGNSLGPLTRRAQQCVQEAVQLQWGEDLIASWNKHAWIDLPFIAAEKIAKLIGAEPKQLVCCDSVSINLLKLLACCLQMQPSRQLVLSQTDNFPTDLYVAQGLESLLGSARCELKTVAEDELVGALDEDVAALFLSDVNFRSSDRHDIERLTAQAKEKGILVIWDLSHSAGVLPLHLDAWNVDFAVGCGYKYLNGGPGAPAFIYANEKHHAALTQPIQGWMGHIEPFAFDPAYRRGLGMAQFLVGTGPILSLSALNGALDTFAAVAICDVHSKTLALSELFRGLMSQDEYFSSFKLESRSDSARRGAHLAYSHEQAYSICRALNETGVVVDFRSPDIIRFGFSPLFLRYEDVWLAVQALREIVSEKTYLAHRFSRKLKVT
mgnify:CR=1 FL=1